MTYPEAHIEVRVKFEAVASQTIDSFLSQEIDLYFNRAIRKFIDDRRPIVLSPRESSQSREATENLRTVLYNHTYSSSALTGVPEMKGGWSVPIANLDPVYEYFIAGRLSTDKDTYSVETTVMRDFYEHLETRHNIPHFRRAKVVERGNKFLLATPDPDETPESLELTYIGEFSRVSSKLAVEYQVSDGSGSQTATIDIQGVSYDMPWNTDAETTIDDFMTNHKDTIVNRHNVIAKDLTDRILFTTYDPNVLESEFGKDDNSGSTVMIQSTTTPRPSIDLPITVHHELVDLTVNLMRSDLPQTQARSEEQ